MIAYHSLTVIHPMWAPAAHKAASQGNAAKLPVPDGQLGGYGLIYFVQADGSVACKLQFRYRATRKQVQVARWVSDYLPDEVRRRPSKPVDTHGRVVLIDTDERQCDEYAKPYVVIVDNENLPMPLHMDALRRCTAQQIVDWLRGLGVMVDAARVEQVREAWAL
jgi:hypothetical protein